MNILSEALSIWETGKRANQEDSIFPSFSDKPRSGDLYILCDGMGGHDKGEVASECVCRAMSSFIEIQVCIDVFSQADFDGALSAAYDALDAADSSTTDEEKKMGTTLTFLKFHSGGAFVAHIGDSRVYHIRPSEKKILFVTRDHSLVNELIDIGELTLEDASSFRQKNIITRAMQPHQNRRIKADCQNIVDVRSGDYFFLCSDGMLEVTSNEQLCNIISMHGITDSEKINILKSVTEGNADNHSALLIKVTHVS